jgi:hydrogenase/urease accessory protein HupE
MKFARWLALFFVFAMLFTKAKAHQVAMVEFEFQKHEKSWVLLGKMDVAYMLPETRNIPSGLPLSRDYVMKSSPEELVKIREDTENTLRHLIQITFAGTEIPWRIEFPDFDNEPFALPETEGNIAVITTRILMDPPTGEGELRIHWNAELQTELIILSKNGDTTNVMNTFPGGDLVLLNQTNADISAPAEKPFGSGWVSSGFRHVLPLGLDHMLFILGLFLLMPKWKPLMGQSLLFTFAHSITLALAVFGLVNVPGKLVEVLIAASIAWIGIENLVVKKLSKQRLILVFFFGLLHGLGFASVLADKLENIPRNELVGPLLGFNVGVELAQISVLATAFLIIVPLSRWLRQIQIVGSAFVALAGLAWIVERLFFA